MSHILSALASWTNSIGLSIIAMSLIVNLALIPCYYFADKIQKKELEIKKTLLPKLTRIKKDFSGEKKMAMMTTLYRQAHYHPIFAFRSVFSLLIQIPFFIAAFHLLENKTDLIGQNFLFLNDLSQPDNVILGWHILPLIMTLINILSSMVFASSQSFQDRVQLVFISLLFLILLYNSPSALVLYWIMNNIFSLIKNIISEKYQNPNTKILLNIANQFQSYIQYFLDTLNYIFKYFKITPSAIRLFLNFSLVLLLVDLTFLYLNLFEPLSHNVEKPIFIWILLISTVLLIWEFRIASRSKNSYSIYKLMILTFPIFLVVVSKFNFDNNKLIIIGFILITFLYLYFKNIRLLFAQSSRLKIKPTFKISSFIPITLWLLFLLSCYFLTQYSSLGKFPSQAQQYINSSLSVLGFIFIICFLSFIKNKSHIAFWYYRIALVTCFSILIFMGILNLIFLFLNFTNPTFLKEIIALILLLTILILVFEHIVTLFNFICFNTFKIVALPFQNIKKKSILLNALIFYLLVKLWVGFQIPPQIYLAYEITHLIFLFLALGLFFQIKQTDTAIAPLIKKITNIQLSIYSIYMSCILVLLFLFIDFSSFTITKEQSIFLVLFQNQNLKLIFISILTLLLAYYSKINFYRNKQNIYSFVDVILPYLSIAILIFFIHPLLLIANSSEIRVIDVARILKFQSIDLILYCVFCWFIIFPFSSKSFRVFLLIMGNSLFAVFFIFSFFITQDIGVFDHLTLHDTSKLDTDITQFLYDITIVAVVIIGFIFLISYRKHFLWINRSSFVLILILFGVSLFQIETRSNELYSNSQSQNNKISSDINSDFNNFHTYNAKKNNTVVIMLDGFPSTYLYQLLNEDRKFMDTFNGFVWYPNTLSKGIYTWTALAPMIGGEQFSLTQVKKSGISFEDNINGAYQNLITQAKNNQYNVNFYNPQYIDCFNLKEVNCINVIGNESNLFKKSIKENYQIALMVSLMRILPTLFKESFYASAFWKKQKYNLAVTYEKSLEIEFFQYFSKTVITKNKAKKEFKFLQLEIPHKPNFYDENCQKMDGVSSYAQESKCALNILKKYIENLKKQNIYNNTTIVVISDHGSSWNRKHFSIDDWNQTIFNELNTKAVADLVGSSVERINPLILVKKAGATEEFRISNTFLSNADLISILCSDFKNCKGVAQDPTVYEIQNRELSITHINDKADINQKNKPLTFHFTVKKNIFDVSNWTQLK